MSNNMHNLRKTKPGILSHPNRKDRIYILTLDRNLATDVYERIHCDSRMKHYQLVRPRKIKLKEAVIEIDEMAPDTVFSSLLIIDVRKYTMPMLRKAYNKIVGYNRMDFNNLCYTILIGDGPLNLFQAGKDLNVFVMDLEDDMYELLVKQAKDLKTSPVDLAKSIILEWLKKNKLDD